MKTVKIKINQKAIKARVGQTILEVAREHGFFIPTLCDHPDLDVKANCRVCVVEIAGRSRLETACSTPVEEGMEIILDSPKVEVVRRTNLELLFASHVEKCASCSRRFDCDLLKYAAKYQAQIARFPDRKAKRPTYRFSNAVELDGSQCIDCGNCIEVCERVQKIGYLKYRGTGIDQEVVPDKQKACVYCGQCALHCPVAAAQEQSAVVAVERAIKDQKKIVVAQFAPAVRVSLGEYFGLPLGANCEGQLISALRALGFSRVFDVNFGADITTLVEAEELLERLKQPKSVLPIMTSCCPAWVAYAETYHPELIPHLTSARSPHIHSAGAIKSYWAKEMKIDPKKIFLVSIMPCTAKKHEASRKELFLAGRPLVDEVLTTRELAYLLKKNNIDIAQLPSGQLESLFNQGSGAAAIYGASGGVMESALRTAAAQLEAAGQKGKKAGRLEFLPVRGKAQIREATFVLGRRRLRVAVVNGLGNVETILPRLKRYDYIEVMACPGGCLGGGGQPIPTTAAIRARRAAGLYAIDKGRPGRRAHENQAANEYVSWVKERKAGKSLLHTRFSRKK